MNLNGKRIALMLLLTAGLAGCQPRLDPQDYGQIVEEVPKIQATDNPYPLPELKDPVDEPQKAAK